MNDDDEAPPTWRAWLVPALFAFMLGTVAGLSPLAFSILPSLSRIETTLGAVDRRVDSIERDGGSVPLSREGRRWLEQHDRELGEIRATLNALDARLDAWMAERRRDRESRAKLPGVVVPNKGG